MRLLLAEDEKELSKALTAILITDIRLTLFITVKMRLIIFSAVTMIVQFST